MPRERSLLRPDDLTIVIDTREQNPLEFEIKIDGCETLKKARTMRKGLVTGDYSILGLEDYEVTIERKSKMDMLACIGSDRERFEREIWRLLAFRGKLIVVEASWDEISQGDYRSRLTPNQVQGSLIGWQDLGIPFFFHPDRRVIASYVAKMLWIHANRCWERLRNFYPGLKVDGEDKSVRS